MGTSLITEKQKKAFYSKIKINEETGCWKWIGALSSGGYGDISINGRTLRAHRLSFLLHKGDLIKGLTLDHLCRNRSCVNPEHLEQVTYQENILRGEGICAINSRKTHCKNGHPLSGKNLHIRPNKGRDCKICKNIINQRMLGTKGTSYITQMFP